VTARPAGRNTLSPAELDELLARPIVGRLATVRADGWPSVVPVWVEWDGTVAWVIARAASRYVEDIRREPRVCLSVVDDADPDRRVQLFAHAMVVAEAAPLGGASLAMARRMAERYEGSAGLAYIERSREWPRIIIQLQPERVVSWTSPDWHARYRSDDEPGPTGPPTDPSEEPRP
jgi:PPOX class probable F420-dependent enzyme